jgi:hypothetical protein
VTHRARSLNVGECHNLTWLDPPARRALAALASATTLTSSAARILESDRPAVERRVNERGIQCQHEVSFLSHSALSKTLRWSEGISDDGVGRAAGQQ